MKKKKTVELLVGFLLLCLLIGLYVLIKSKNEASEEDASEDEEEEAEIIFSLSEDDVASLNFQAEGLDVTWIKDGDDWIYEADESFPTDSSSVSDLITDISSLSSERTIEDVEDPAEYGLEDPENVIKVVKTDDTETTITVGLRNSSTDTTYIALDGDLTTVYSVSENIASDFSGGLYTYVTEEEFPTITASYIQSIDVDKIENSYQVDSNGGSQTGYSVTDQDGEEKEADSTAVSTLETTITSLAYSGIYEYNCEDWSEYGLDDPVATIHVDYQEEVEVEAEESDEEDEDDDSDEESETVTKLENRELDILVGGTNEEGNYYVRVNGSTEVRGISQTTLDGILDDKAFDYWKLSITYVSLTNLDYLDVTYDGQTYELKRVSTEETETTTNDDGEEEETTTTVVTYYVDNTEVETSDFTDFYSECVAMTCQSRLEEYEDEKDAELVLHYYASDGSEVEVAYITRDANFYTVIDSDGNYGLVNKMNVKELIEKLDTLLGD